MGPALSAAGGEVGDVWGVLLKARGSSGVPVRWAKSHGKLSLHVLVAAGRAWLCCKSDVPHQHFNARMPRHVQDVKVFGAGATAPGAGLKAKSKHVGICQSRAAGKGGLQNSWTRRRLQHQWWCNIRGSDSSTVGGATKLVQHLWWCRFRDSNSSAVGGATLGAGQHKWRNISGGAQLGTGTATQLVVQHQWWCTTRDRDSNAVGGATPAVVHN
eukprot:1161187-Pelagomonas_calceolata.AAC.2